MAGFPGMPLNVWVTFTLTVMRKFQLVFKSLIDLLIGQLWITSHFHSNPFIPPLYTTAIFLHQYLSSLLYNIQRI